MNGASLYECEIRHARRSPLVNRFTYRSYLWLVDVDHLPRLPWPVRALARFVPEDHFGDDGRPPGGGTIRGGVDRFLDDHGIDLGGGRVLMLSTARVLGYVFNPISVFWCHGADGRLRCVVVEVHNTYGERHCYLVRTDDSGRGEVGKSFYVSPFEPVHGRYEMSLPMPGETLHLSITLHRHGEAPFVATVTGSRRDATVAGVVGRFARHPMAPLVVTARIRRQGIGLWARGLPVVPRPTAPQEVLR